MRAVLVILLVSLVGCVTSKKAKQPEMPSELPQPMLPSNYLSGENPYAPRMGDALEIQTFK